MRWVGGGSFNDIMDRLGNMGDLKREKGMGEAIAELKSLISGQRMGSNSPGKLNISCSLAGRIRKNVDLWKSTKIGNGSEDR